MTIGLNTLGPVTIPKNFGSEFCHWPESMGKFPWWPESVGRGVNLDHRQFQQIINAAVPNSLSEEQLCYSLPEKEFGVNGRYFRGRSLDSTPNSFSGRL